LCAHSSQPAWQGSSLFSLVHHGVLSSFAKHVHHTFAMWTVPRNARVDQDRVCATDWDQDGWLGLVWWTGLLGSLCSRNGLGGHGTWCLCRWRHTGGKCTALKYKSILASIVRTPLHNDRTDCKSTKSTCRVRLLVLQWLQYIWPNPSNFGGNHCFLMCAPSHRHRPLVIHDRFASCSGTVPHQHGWRSPF
jgi:hypothetical protein